MMNSREELQHILTRVDSALKTTLQAEMAKGAAYTMAKSELEKHTARANERVTIPHEIPQIDLDSMPKTSPEVMALLSNTSVELRTLRMRLKEITSNADLANFQVEVAQFEKNLFINLCCLQPEYITEFIDADALELAPVLQALFTTEMLGTYPELEQVIGAWEFTLEGKLDTETVVESLNSLPLAVRSTLSQRGLLSNTQLEISSPELKNSLRTNPELILNFIDWNEFDELVDSVAVDRQVLVTALTQLFTVEMVQHHPELLDILEYQEITDKNTVNVYVLLETLTLLHVDTITALYDGDDSSKVEAVLSIIMVAQHPEMNWAEQPQAVRESLAHYVISMAPDTSPVTELLVHWMNTQFVTQAYLPIEVTPEQGTPHKFAGLSRELLFREVSLKDLLKLKKQDSKEYQEVLSLLVSASMAWINEKFAAHELKNTLESTPPISWQTADNIFSKAVGQHGLKFADMMEESDYPLQDVATKSINNVQQSIYDRVQLVAFDIWKHFLLSEREAKHVEVMGDLLTVIKHTFAKA
jgi:hypothetical protein